MLSIGEFSYSTGITVKTLRYYDEIGLLPAADVDESNGYRYYSATQIDTAAVLRMLRAAGASITQMKRAITHPHELPIVVQERHQEIKAQRALEDWALEAVGEWHHVNSVEVHERSCEPQPWVGFVFSVDVRVLDSEPTIADRVGAKVDSNLEAIQDEVKRAGLAADDAAWWTEMEADPQRPAIVHVTVCVPTREPVPADFAVAGVEVVHGELAARKEAFVAVEVLPSAGDQEYEIIPGGALPTKASIALGVYLEQCGAEHEPVRQSCPRGDGGGNDPQATLIELAATVG